MRLSDTFLTRKRAKSAAAWLDLRGVKFKIKSALNEEYINAIQKMQKKKRALGDISDKEYAKLIAKHLVLEWKELEDDDGNPLECTEENKVMLLTDYIEISATILEFASEPENFIEFNDTEDELGN